MVLLKKFFFPFWLCWVFIVASTFSLVAVLRLLISAVSFVSEHGICGVWPSVVGALGL